MRRTLFVAAGAAAFAAAVVGSQGASGSHAAAALAGWQTPGPFHTPSGPWLTPGAFHTPGQIQVPKGIKAITTHQASCAQKLSVAADALFAFDKATLSPDAAKTLSALGPLIKKAGNHPIQIDGYTDAIGSDAYNLQLSEQRAATVRDWLAAHGYVPATTPIKGYGKADPVAPNMKPDGSDDPQGRQKNRRVEVVIQTCK